MAQWQPTRPAPTAWSRLRRRAAAAVPVVVWLAAAAALLPLSTWTPSAHRLHGIVESMPATVLAPVDGRIAAMTVRLHQLVEADQVIARLDDRDVRLRLAQANFQLERLRADMAHAQAALEREARLAANQHGMAASVEHRRLVSAIEAAQLSALSTRTELEEARIRLQGAAIEAERLTTLADQQMIGEPELVRVRTERDALKKRTEDLETLYREQRAQVSTANQRLAEFAPGQLIQMPIDTVVAPLRWQLKEQEAEIERIALDAQALDLRAPVRGHVATLDAATGEWATRGRVIATILDPTPRRIRAYAPDVLRPRLEASRRLQVHRADATRLGASEILSISPTAVLLPQRLWRDPQREEWGYEIVLAATGTELPGERLQLAPLP
jgi:multidrug resistance efflux pump